MPSFRAITILCLPTLSWAAAVLPRAGCNTGACLKAISVNPAKGVKTCSEATAEQGQNPIASIKCPFTALGEVKGISECAECTIIGEPDNPHSRRDLQERQNSRDLFEDPGYRDFCIEQGGAYMVTNAGNPKTLAYWRLIWVSPPPSEGRLHTCDHIVELNFLKSFFASPPMRGNKYQRVWNGLINPGDNRGDADQRNSIKNSLNNPANLVSVDEEVNRLKYQVLARDVAWTRSADWSAKAIVGTREYLKEVKDRYKRVTKNIGQKLDRFGDWGPDSTAEDRISLAWQRFCDIRFGLAIRRLTRRINQLGPDFEDPRGNFDESLPGATTVPVDPTYRPGKDPEFDDIWDYVDKELGASEITDVDIEAFKGDLEDELAEDKGVSTRRA